jgi:hypothetical protein
MPQLRADNHIMHLTRLINTILITFPFLLPFSIMSITHRCAISPHLSSCWRVGIGTTSPSTSITGYSPGDGMSMVGFEVVATLKEFRNTTFRHCHCSVEEFRRTTYIRISRRKFQRGLHGFLMVIFNVYLQYCIKFHVKFLLVDSLN